MNKDYQCWNFIMSSFSRSYGVERTTREQKFHEIALEWCDEHEYICEVYLNDLNAVDLYFRSIYENWKK